MRKILTIAICTLIIALFGFSVVSDSAREAVVPEAVAPTVAEEYSVATDFAYRLEKAFDSSPDSMEVWIRFNTSFER